MSAVGIVLLSTAYVATLIAGLVSLPSPEQPIRDPPFAVLEILILLMMPLMVALMVAVHAWASAEGKVFGLMAVGVMTVLAGVTTPREPATRPERRKPMVAIG